MGPKGKKFASFHVYIDYRKTKRVLLNTCKLKYLKELSKLFLQSMSARGESPLSLVNIYDLLLTEKRSVHKDTNKEKTEKRHQIKLSYK